MHHRGGAVLPGGGDQGFVRQGQQAAGGGDAVGKGGQVREIGQLLCQQRRIDEGIGIAVEQGGA